MSNAVAVVILAGGEGSRIGGQKPLRTLHGERLIDRALRQAHSWSDVVALSVREPAHVGSTEAQIVTDEPGIAGPIAGLVSALRFASHLGCEFVLTIPTDMPVLPADLLERLRCAVGSRACALASSGGHLHPVCGLWLRTASQSIGGYLTTGKRSLRGFAEHVGFETAEWPVEPLDPFFNVNTEADLVRAESLT